MNSETPAAASPDLEPPPMLAHPVHALLRAARYAARKHKGQTRLDGATPYFAHLTGVVMVLRHVFAVTDEQALTAAFLHDILEDTRTDYDELADLFGPEVTDYVVALTKNPLLSKKDREKEFEHRLLQSPEVVKLIKLADLFDNLMFRIETPRLIRTLTTARRVVEAFRDRMETDLGRRAFATMERLVVELEAEAGQKT